MRRITLILTDDEYAALEARAQGERRSTKQMAERLVTQPPFLISQPSSWPVADPFNPIWPPRVWCGTTDATGTNTHTVWNNIGVNPDA